MSLLLSSLFHQIPVFADSPAASVEEFPQTGFTIAVPSAYFQASDKPGTLVEITYDSEDYVRDSAPITKNAVVYLPSGYDETDTETRYDILYLMHGWTGHAGDYFEYSNLTNMFDLIVRTPFCA